MNQFCVRLDILEDRWLVVIGDNGLAVLLGDDLTTLAVHLQKLGNIEAWLLENLDLLDMDLVKWVG